MSKIAVVVLVMLSSNVARADDLAALEKARTLCAGCHGPAGISVNPLWPNLAGQHAAYIAKSLHDYKSGARDDPSMSLMARTLTDAEIDALAAHYASLGGR